LRSVCGKPLIAWSIEQARASARLERVIVSTDDAEIAEIARDCGAEVPFLRPPDLALDTTPTEPVLLHAIAELGKNGYEPDAVILLQPTSPARKPDTIDRAIGQFEDENADSLLGVCETHHFFWKNPRNPQALYDFRNRPLRQAIPVAERWFRENGSIYITRSSVLTAEGNRLGGKIAMFRMSEEESWEIDSETDFKILEVLLSEVVGS